ncbi:MAG TPA: GAP family protein [Solirubrobacteraceae bacterium]
MAQSGASVALAVSAIALPDSLNPSLIGVAIYLAARPHPWRRTAAFTAAAFAVTFAGGVVLALGLGDLILSLVPKPSKTLKYILEIAVGVVLVIGGTVIWWRRQALASDPSVGREAHGGGSAVLLGAGVAGIELLTALPYFAAIAIIVGSPVSGGAKLSLLFLYNVIYLLPLFAIVAVCCVIGERAGRVLAPVGDWINTHWPMVVAPLAALVGVALVAYGIVKLA